MSVQLQTAIWQEEPASYDAFAVERARCHGYDVYGELVGRAQWGEMVLLLLTGERPSPAKATLLNDLAVAIANPGPREASVNAAMCGGVSGSPAAAVLAAALAVGAGQGGGGRDVFMAMEALVRCGTDLDAWRADVASPPVERDDVWPVMEHRPGFDPHATVMALPVRQTIDVLVTSAGHGGAVAWLRDHAAILGAIVGAPVSMAGIAAAALLDLGLSPAQGEMLYLLLRLPGAAAHALEQAELGFKAFPFPEIELLDDPAERLALAAQAELGLDLEEIR